MKTRYKVELAFWITVAIAVIIWLNALAQSVI